MKLIFLVFTFPVFWSCNSNDHSFAEVNEAKLTWEMVQPHVSGIYKGKDSIQELKQITNNWITEELLVQEAAEKGFDNSPEIEHLVNDYKRQLMVHLLEEDYLQKNLDTNITEQEMRSYFNSNKENFMLGKNIVKLVFIKCPKSSPQLSELKKLIYPWKEQNLEKLRELALTSCENHYLNSEIWLEFEELLKEIPIKTYDGAQFLQNNKFLEISEGESVYLVNIIDYRVRNQVSEFEFEKLNIRKIILFNRKKDLLNKYKNQLVQDAFLQKKAIINAQKMD
ncbi:MAG: hypothetical protein L6Q78_00995 [Bacteroidia bacterium]|nr:hypothetical protein [Bacteroidia bacterium]